ncbi:CLUMA_CG011306, isoform A [Clunio marinus]|uniref:CLUMA_CG011306, isoform A n=1 Tax=Clunio marinus TaxID=568069 RepID=A0A1J1ICC1_9DIPT|nr:CLUMA_CG011306, isoform A [Clunio marinus]
MKHAGDELRSHFLNLRYIIMRIIARFMSNECQDVNEKKAKLTDTTCDNLKSFLAVRKALRMEREMRNFALSTSTFSLNNKLNFEINDQSLEECDHVNDSCGLSNNVQHYDSLRCFSCSDVMKTNKETEKRKMQMRFLTKD